VTLCGGESRFAPLTQSNGDFILDLDRVRSLVDRNTRMIMVNSPSNPTGWMISREDQVALLELAETYDLRILSDEVYERITYDVDVAPSFARLAGSKDRLIVANSFSKTYCMTGWRLGWAQASAAMIRAMTTGVEFMTSNASAPVQQAGIVALRDGEAYVGELRAHFAARRQQVVDALAEMPGVGLAMPRGSFFAFFTVAGVADSSAFALELLRETGIALAPGSAFGPGGEQFLRLCFASSEATMTESLRRISDFLRLPCSPGMRAETPAAK
jgi:aspartate aminotransferase